MNCSLNNQKVHFQKFFIIFCGQNIVYPPGRIVHFRDIFPFWDEMKIAFMASCDDFHKNFLAQNHNLKFLFYEKCLYF